MDRDLFVSESGKAAFRISQVSSMRMKGKTHVVQMQGGDEHYISTNDAARLKELQGSLPVFPHLWFAGEDYAFDAYYITCLRTVKDGVEISFDASSGIAKPVILSEKEFSKLATALNIGEGTWSR